MRNPLVLRRGAHRMALLLFALVVLLLVEAGHASAAMLKVCPSGCYYTTIAGALAASSDGDKILIGAGTYGGGFTISSDVSLIGAGAGQTTISGGGSVVTVAILHQVTISGVTITGGSAELGGGILNGGGTLTLRDTTISGNSASEGGGIFNVGSLTLKDSTVSGNGAVFGGGISNQGTLTLKDSNVTGNQAGSGGGILNNGVATLKESAVWSNTATIDGGGILNYGILVLLESTVSGNTPNDCVGPMC
jgi:hypothetical protein